METDGDGVHDAGRERGEAREGDNRHAIPERSLVGPGPERFVGW